jgi:ParB/RepB/Spo0J family partition protein
MPTDETQDERAQAASEAGYVEDADPIVGLRTRALLNAEPGHHPPSDSNLIDPESFLGRMVARANSGSIIPTEPTEADEAAFYAQLREDDDLPSDTYRERPSIAALRKTLRERLHPLVEAPTETLEIPLDKILVDDFDLRSTMDPDDQARLVASIATSGLINPLVVRRDDRDPDLYHLICGAHRREALLSLGKTHARCTVRGPLSERDVLLLNLGENLARRTLTSFQLASQIELLVRKFMLRPEEIAGALGMSAVHVRSFLRYLSTLPPDVISDWKNAHPALTHRMLARIVREPFPSRTWQQIRSRSEIAENAVPTTFVPTDEDLDQSGWEPFRRPTRAKLARARDILMRAKLPADPEKIRELLVGLVDWTRGARRSVPHLLVPTLKDRPKPRRLAKTG